MFLFLFVFSRTSRASLKCIFCHHLSITYVRILRMPVHELSRDRDSGYAFAPVIVAFQVSLGHLRRQVTQKRLRVNAYLAV